MIRLRWALTSLTHAAWSPGPSSVLCARCHGPRLTLRGPWTGALAPDASTLFRQSLCALRITPLDLKHGYFGRYFRDRNDLLDVVPVIAKFKVWPILAALFVLMHISAAESSGIPRCPGAYGGGVWNDCLVI